jgi:CheY-like chemotaxis protein
MSQPEVPGRIQPAARNTQVLLVEDDDPSAIFATVALERFGCNVSRARDGDEAVNAAAQHSFDLILMDYHLPLRNGLEATRLIRAATPQPDRARIPIVGLTASSSREEQAQCLSAGMDDVLFKPFLLAELGRMLGRWIPAH